MKRFVVMCLCVALPLMVWAADEVTDPSLETWTNAATLTNWVNGAGSTIAENTNMTYVYNGNRSAQVTDIIAGPGGGATECIRQVVAGPGYIAGDDPTTVSVFILDNETGANVHLQLGTFWTGIGGGGPAPGTDRRSPFSTNSPSYQMLSVDPAACPGAPNVGFLICAFVDENHSVASSGLSLLYVDNFSPDVDLPSGVRTWKLY